MSSIMDIPLSFFNDENFNKDNITPFLSQSLPLEENDYSKFDFIFDNSNRIPKYKFNISKIQRNRKEDYIRKKAKTISHKYIISDINDKLRKAGSKLFFESFPQHYMADITQKTNSEAMQKTFLELIDFTYNNFINDKNYSKKIYNQKAINATNKKYDKNKKTLAYLDSNPEISKKSGWDRIKNTKYVDLLNKYFGSETFGQYVQELSKKEDEEYIKSFKYFSKTYTQFFLSYRNNEKNNKIQISNTNNNNNIDNSSERKEPNLKEETPFLISEANDLSEIFNFNNSGDFMDENSLFPDEIVYFLMKTLILEDYGNKYYSKDYLIIIKVDNFENYLFI